MPQTLEQKWESLTLANDFIFGKVMSRPSLCKKLLERIFPDMKIERIEYPELQKAIKEDYDAKSVRLDVYVRDGQNTVYNIEIQTADTGDLPKRARYYQSMIDLQLIDRGEHYKNLNRSYVIFICTEDVFHKGRHKYTFQNVCREDAAIDLGDETTKIFLNTKGTVDDVDAKLKAVLDYIDGVRSADPYVEELDHAVMEVKRNREWRREYMTLAMKLSESYDKGLEAGREEGRAEGRKEGRAEGIKNMITVLRDLGISEPVIQRKLQEKYELTREQIKTYF